MPTTLSNPTPSPVKGTYGFRSRQWDRKRGLASECGACFCPHITEAEARVGICERCELQDGSVCPTCAYAAGQTSESQLAADTADLFSGEPPAEPSLSDVIANLEAARARVEALDAMTAGEEPVEEAQAGTWDEGCKSWEFFCKGCGRTRPSTERVEAYIKRDCRIIATLELCAECGSQVSVCVRG